MNPSQGDFPPDFLWGTATAAYQIEGATAADGRKPSIWDRFAETPGKTFQGQTGRDACDHYHRYPEDVALMQRLGAGAYRFSVAWSRLFPDGDGRRNEAGFAFYDRLVDALLSAGIQPWMTLYHWDLPQALEDRFGSWAGRDTVHRFADYAAAVAAHFSDRVKHFITTNEFENIVEWPHRNGSKAPGTLLPRKALNAARHNILLGHGLAAQAVRANAGAEVKVGIAESPRACVPIMETEAHIAAARRACRLHGLHPHFLTPLFEGAYPAEFLEAEGADAPVFTDAEMRVIATPLDFFGINNYSPTYIRAADNALGFEALPHAPAHPASHAGWQKLGPEAIYWAARMIHELWRPPALYVTENGMCCDDQMNRNGEILDTDRLMYFRHSLGAVRRATAEGIPLKGFFAWSLLDNFEWSFGYSHRFGLVHVNFESFERTPKLSFDYYREVIAANRLL